MTVTIKDKDGKCYGRWVAKTKRGLSQKQWKEIAQARKDAGWREGVELVEGYYKRYGIK